MTNDYKKVIGARVKNARLLRGLTQEQLAEKLDVSVSCISRFETGSSIPSVKGILGLSEALGVGVDYLLHDFISEAVVSDPLTSEILLHIEPLPENYKKYVLDSIISLYQTLPTQDE